MQRGGLLRLTGGVASVTILLLGSLIAGPGSASAAPSPKLTVTPSTGLNNGETVIIRGTGFKAKDVVFLVECLRKAQGSAQCRVVGIPPSATITAAGVLVPTKFVVTTGKVGSGVCGTKPTNLSSCDLSAGNANGGDSATAPITFANKK